MAPCNHRPSANSWKSYEIDSIRILRIKRSIAPFKVRNLHRSLIRQFSAAIGKTRTSGSRCALAKIPAVILIFAETYRTRPNRHGRRKSASQRSSIRFRRPRNLPESDFPASQKDLVIVLPPRENPTMARESAGLLMYRKTGDDLEVFLVHPGGPFFAKKDAGAWTIPKGEPNPGEPLLETALREFREETGIASTPPYLELGCIKQKGGKTVHAWAFAGNWREEDGIVCNTFELIWPPRSGKTRTFPEIDRAAFFPLSIASEKLNPAQLPFLQRLQTLLPPS